MYLVIFSMLLIHVRGELALLSAISQQSNDEQVYCVAYSEKWDLQLPSSPTHYLNLIIPDDSEKDGCRVFSTNCNHSAVLINSANCSVDEKLQAAQLAGVQLLLISGSLDTGGLTNPPVTMVIVSEKSAGSLDDDNTMVTIYLPASSFPFGGIILLFTIAMVTIMAASALANDPYKFLRNGLLYRNSQPAASIDNLQLSLWQAAIAILLFVTLVIAFLVLLYFFYSVVIYVAIAIYCLLCIRSVYSFLSPFIALVSFTSQWRLPANNWPILQYRPDPRFFLTLLFSILLVLAWCLLRHASYAWMLHDLLGFLFICFAVKQFKTLLNYLWPLAVLMMILFVYDIFFVFITPMFTKNNVSVMETVATGEGTGSNEKIPFLFEVPRLMHYTSLESICEISTPLLLGYGDVGLPAVLITFALHMDKILHPNVTLRVYYIITIIGYAIGFLLCIIALSLMKTGQPALLYLVPSTLGPFVVSSLIRGEFLIVWRGKKKDTGDKIVPPKKTSCKEEQTAHNDDECDDIEQSPLLSVQDIDT